MYVHRMHINVYETVFWKTDHPHTSIEIHLLPVHNGHTHALSRNTKHWSIDYQVCFYGQLFTDAVKPRGCISWSWGALIGLHRVPIAPHGSLGLPCGLYQFMSHTEGTALLFESKWLF